MTLSEIVQNEVRPQVLKAHLGEKRQVSYRSNQLWEVGRGHSLASMIF